MATKFDAFIFLRGAVMGLVVAKKDAIWSALMQERYDDAVADGELILHALKEFNSIAKLMDVHEEKGLLMVNYMIENFDEYRGE